MIRTWPDVVDLEDGKEDEPRALDNLSKQKG